MKVDPVMLTHGIRFASRVRTFCSIYIGRSYFQLLCDCQCGLERSEVSIETFIETSIETYPKLS